MTKNPAARPRLLATVVITLALIVGGLAGATLDRAVLRPLPSTAYTAGPGPHADPVPESSADGNRARRRVPESGGRGMPLRMNAGARYLDQLTRDLDLTAAQRAQIEELLRQQQERMRAVRHESREQSGAIVAETRAGILEILTPEQRAHLRPPGREQANGRRPGIGRGPVDRSS